MSLLSSKPSLASNCTKNGIPTPYPANMTGPCSPLALTSCQSPPPLSIMFPTLFSQNLGHCSSAFAHVSLLLGMLFSFLFCSDA